MDILPIPVEYSTATKASYITCLHFSTVQSRNLKQDSEGFYHWNQVFYNRWFKSSPVHHLPHPEQSME